MIRVTFALLFGSVLLLEAQPPPQTPREQAMTVAASQLAARTSSLLPRRSSSLPPSIVSLEWQNLTSMPTAEWWNFRTLLQDELRKAGLQTAGTLPEWRVRVTLSEGARGLLFVAEVSNGDNRQVAMLPWVLPSSTEVKPRISLTRKVLRTQPEPMLDILFVDSDALMLVLSTNKVASFRLMGDKWTLAATAALPLSRPLPRDPRGRLEAAADGFRAYLPTATCQGTFMPELRLTCVNGTENWPDMQMRWVADLNTLESDAVKAPFYASSGGVFAMADGRVQNQSGQPVAGSEGWDSNIAGVADPCGAGGSAPVVIATSANNQQEEVRVYEIANNQATAASDAMPLPGAVTALWPAESRGKATLVVRNPQTGNYEASRLGLACTE